MKAAHKINIAMILFVTLTSRINFEFAIVLAFVLMIGAAVWSMQGHGDRVRNYRIRRGVCAKCEYDLREIASERCPECGEPIQRTQLTKSRAAPINYGPEGADL